jgi:hypothetical protein
MRRTVNESVEFFWDAGLRNPFPVADYVVAVENDPVGRAAKRYRTNLEFEEHISSPGEAPATIYSRRPLGTGEVAQRMGAPAGAVGVGDTVQSSGSGYDGVPAQTRH